MYLSAGLSGMCMRKEIQGKSDHKETDPSQRTGDGRKSALKERQAQNF